MFGGRDDDDPGHVDDSASQDESGREDELPESETKRRRILGQPNLPEGVSGSIYQLVDQRAHRPAEGLGA